MIAGLAPGPSRPLRVGIVCPYSFDVPGGVQFHVRDLAEALIGRGHSVSVLAPADDDTPIPEYMTSAGKAVPVRYNGSVARLAFGPITAAKVRRWLEAGQFDVLHLHEPATPSLSMLALWIADGPVVATFHSSLVRSRSLQIAYPLVRQSLEKIGARIAVSEDARRTLVEHLGGDAVVIPNGVFVDAFRGTPADPRWAGTPEAPTVVFLGRLDEPRKGLPVLLGAVPEVRRAFPGARFLVAGRGDTGPDEVRELIGDDADAVEFLGGISDEDKARLLASADVVLRTADRRRVVRHRAGRGDERGHRGAGVGPRRVPAGARRRAGRGAVPDRRLRRPRARAGRAALRRRGAGADRGGGRGRRGAVRLVDGDAPGADRVRDGRRGQRGAGRRGPDLAARCPDGAEAPAG